MIIDFHTHIFPPEVAANRESLLRDDATFRELYSHPEAMLAQDTDLIDSMDAAGIDASLALGFAWASEEVCRQHNNYLIEAAARSDGRIIPFCTLPLGAGIEAVKAEMQRCVDVGVKGFGELRPDNLGFDLAGPEGEDLATLASNAGAILLFHASEPVGHRYAGKEGGNIAALYSFIEAHPETRIVAAHWGGGLPFYALMPEVGHALEAAATCFDTAASSLLYDARIFDVVSKLTGVGSILFGSDYPLLSQKRSLQRIREQGLSEGDVALISGGNAARLLGLDQ